jgi:hypothetical protein
MLEDVRLRGAGGEGAVGSPISRPSAVCGRDAKDQIPSRAPPNGRAGGPAGGGGGRAPKGRVAGGGDSFQVPVGDFRVGVQLPRTTEDQLPRTVGSCPTTTHRGDPLPRTAWTWLRAAWRGIYYHARLGLGCALPGEGSTTTHGWDFVARCLARDLLPRTAGTWLRAACLPGEGSGTTHADYYICVFIIHIMSI